MIGCLKHIAAAFVGVVGGVMLHSAGGIAPEAASRDESGANELEGFWFDAEAINPLRRHKARLPWHAVALAFVWPHGLSYWNSAMALSKGP